MMHFAWKWLPVLAVLASLGCSMPKQPIGMQMTKPDVMSPSDRAIMQQTLALLREQYKDWRGVKYQLGGTSKRGVDCSAFVQETYSGKFGVALPRTTKMQSSLGVEVGRHALQAGDLVFFKTSFFIRHVGMYLQDDNFLHVSTQRGVMISNLRNTYWSKKYWKAKRVLQ